MQYNGGVAMLVSPSIFRTFKQAVSGIIRITEKSNIDWYNREQSELTSKFQAETERIRTKHERTLGHVLVNEQYGGDFGHTAEFLPPDACTYDYQQHGVNSLVYPSGSVYGSMQDYLNDVEKANSILNRDIPVIYDSKGHCNLVLQNHDKIKLDFDFAWLPVNQTNQASQTEVICDCVNENWIGDLDDTDNLDLSLDGLQAYKGHRRFGYTLDGDPEPEELELTATMLSMRSQGASWQAISDFANKTGIKPLSRNPWSRGGVRQIIITRSSRMRGENMTIITIKPVHIPDLLGESPLRYCVYIDGQRLEPLHGFGNLHDAKMFAWQLCCKPEPPQRLDLIFALPNQEMGVLFETLTT